MTLLRRRGVSGQAMTEFLLVLPFLLLVLFGLMQIVLLMGHGLKLQYASYMAARSACVHPGGEGGYAHEAAAACPGMRWQASGALSVPLTWADAGSSGGRTFASVELQAPLVLPFMDRFLGRSLVLDPEAGEAAGRRFLRLRAFCDMRQEGE